VTSSASESAALGISLPPGEEGPITVVVSRRIKPGREADYEAWARGICGDAIKFEGHLGVTILRPQGRERPEYVLIFRFATLAHLRSWEESAVRRQWLERVDELTQEEPHVQKVTGLEYWFTLPGNAATVPPPRHKMAVVTVLAVFPVSTSVMFVLRPWLEQLPLLLRGLVISVMLVVLMTYLVMPLYTRLFARWLFGPLSGVSKREKT
jgi:antibiotic biosynthesis monooxygenase (ABM) superfamily enzyme